MTSRIILSILLFAALVLSGCAPRPKLVEIHYDNPLLPGQLALRRITDPYQIPDFTMACLDLKDLRSAVAKSINYLQKPSSKRFFPSGQITHEHALASLKAFVSLLDSGLTAGRLDQAIKDKFDVYMSVGCDNKGTVLFTGYYTPIFDGSRIRTDTYRYPLYKQPQDLIKGADGQIIGRRMPDGHITQYPPRAVIENSGMLKGNELIWLSNPFEAYIANVQGSAKIRLRDGQIITVGYAASNGYEYRSIAKELIRQGKISASQMSLSAMIDYFKNHAEELPAYTHLNPRYVFFKEQTGQPRGSLNEPVTPMRTIATDKSIFPRACLAFISTTLPRASGGQITNQLYSGFALDQDTGGAIRAAGRCDIYMGVGDSAGKLAGHTYQEGKLYYLFLKPEFMHHTPG